MNSRWIVAAVLTAALVFLAAGWATSAECCPGGACGAGTVPVWSGPVRLSSDVPQRHQYPALVAVHYVLPSGEKRVGSGTIVAAGSGVAEVLTCAHGYDESARVVVLTQAGERYQATVRGMDRQQDVALVSIQDPKIPAMNIAETEPQPGEDLYACGFEGGVRPMGFWGRAVQWVGPSATSRTWIEVSCASYSGMSGGPIVNRRGQVVGLITGSAGRTCIGPCLPRVRAVLRFLLPPYRRPVIAPVRPDLSPPQGRASGGDRGSSPGGASIPTSPLPGSGAGQGELGKLMEAHAALSARVATLEKRVDALEQVKPAVGPPGPAGPPGPQGAPGSAATIDIEKLAAAVSAAVVLPPIRIQTLNPDGSVHQDVQARLGDLIKLKPIPVRPEGK